MMSMHSKGHCLLAVVLLSTIGSTFLYALDVERSDYRITVPDECTIAPEKPNIDLDHLTMVEFPDGSYIIVMVSEDKEKTEGAFVQMKERYAAKMEGVNEAKSTFLAEHKGKAALLKGDMKKIPYTMELGWFNGTSKGYIIVAGSPQSERSHFAKDLQKTITSFKEK